MDGEMKSSVEPSRAERPEGIAQPQELESLIAVLRRALPYVARYEGEHFSNAALDVLIDAEAAIRAAEQSHTQSLSENTRER